MGCGNDWRELCSRSMLHGGDCDSTGCIAASFYGEINGFNGVNQNNYKDIEYKKRISDCGFNLFSMRFQYD